MDYKKICFFILILVLFVSGCINQNSDTTGNIISNADGEREINIDKLEIYHFHGAHQCYSCKTVGQYAEETINTYFAKQVMTGKISFAHINIDLPENQELVERYGVTGASLWIGVYGKNSFHKEENANVWYKISDKNEYTNYLKSLIEKRLSGDLG